MLEETPEVPEREHLARDLEHMGFGAANVERALDWLADLAGRAPAAAAAAAGTPGSAGVRRQGTGAAVDRMPRAS